MVSLFRELTGRWDSIRRLPTRQAGQLLLRSNNSEAPSLNLGGEGCAKQPLAIKMRSKELPHELRDRCQPYYDPTTEVALEAAFRDIAVKIATLRLTN
jgi:hypothetical protein